MEVYNGKEKHPGQEKDYHAKIQGYFLKENIAITNLYEIGQPLQFNINYY